MATSIKHLSLSTFAGKRQELNGIKKALFTARHPLLEISYRVSWNEFKEMETTLKNERENCERQKEEFGKKAHDLKNKIGVISGCFEMLEEMIDKNNAEKQQVFKLAHNAFKNFMVKAIAMIDEVKGIHIEAVELNAEIRQILAVFKPKAEQKKIYLNFKEGDMAIAEVDKHRFDLVISNLIDNALKFTKEGGISIKTARHEEYIVITVKDTGIGIPEKELNDIFKRYNRGDRHVSTNHPGDGIGLSAVKDDTEKMHGRIGIHSKVGEGSTFTLKFPAVQIRE